MTTANFEKLKVDGTSELNGATTVTSPSGGANTGLIITQAANNGTAVLSYTSIDFNVPTTGLIGQFFSTASNYSNASIPANSIGLFSESTNGKLVLGAGGSNGVIDFVTGGYAAANIRVRIYKNGDMAMISDQAFYFGAASDASIGFDGDSLNIVANRVNSADAMEFTAGRYEFKTGSIGIGITSPTAKLHVISTTEQLRLGYNASNYLSFTITSNNTVTLANAVAADININCGTDKTLVLTESVWEDIQFPIEGGRVPASNYPTYESFTSANIEAFAFSVDDKIQLSSNEPPHGWAEGTVGSAHIHFALKTAQTTGSDRFVKFELIFAYSDYNGVWTEQAAITQEQTIPTASSALKSFLTTFTSTVTLTGLHLGSQIKCCVKRIAATGGTEYADDVYITQVGVHVEKVRIGSRGIGSA